MKSPSRYALYLVGLVWLLSFLFYKPWESAILGRGDRSGYYLYLPSTFIHGDIYTMDETRSARNEYDPHRRETVQYQKNGNYLNQYTCGVSLLNLPGFSIAHLIAKISNYKVDGFSLPYNFMIVWSGLFYIFIGFLFLRKYLLNFFKEGAVAFTLVLLALGTNLYFTAILQNPMAHGFLFFLIAILLYVSEKWNTSRKPKLVFLIAFILGFIGLVRPNLIIVALIPFTFYENTFSYVLKNIKYFLIAILFFLIPFIPQFIYWKIITGSFIYYSYGDQGFDFLHPHLVEGVFSFKNGWLAYTPLMVFGVIGLLFGSFSKNRKAIVSSILVAIHIYIVYSWWCWNYINGFGSRAMVDLYPVLAIGVAFYYQKINRSFILKYISIGLLLFFSGLNIFQTYQSHIKVLWTEEANAAYYLSVFGKTSLDHDALVALDCNILQPKDLIFKSSIAIQDFEGKELIEKDSVEVYDGDYSFLTSTQHQFSKGIKTTVEGMENYQADWFKISTQARSTAYGTIRNNAHLVISINRGSEKVLWKSIRINNKIRDTYYSVHNGEINQWKEVSFYVPLEKVNVTSSDLISVYVWNTSSIPVYVDDLKLEIWGR